MQTFESEAQQTPQMTIWLSRASAGLSVFVLALAFALSDLWAGVAAVLAGGALWLLGHLRALRWTSSVALIVLVTAAAIAVSHSIGGGWPVLGLVAALVAWDLDQFAQLVRAAGRVDGARDLELRHIRRLLAVASIGGLLAGIGMGLRVRFSFELALVLGALVMLGLSIAVGYLRRLRD